MSGGNIQHVRVCMTGDANLDLQVYIYREVEDPRTGEVGEGVPLAGAMGRWWGRSGVAS